MAEIPKELNDSLNTINNDSEFHTNMTAMVDYFAKNNDMAGLEQTLAAVIQTGEMNRQDLDLVSNYVKDSIDVDLDFTPLNSLFEPVENLNEAISISKVSYSASFIDDLESQRGDIVAQIQSMERLPEYQEYARFVDVEDKLTELEYGWANNAGSQLFNMFTGPIDKQTGNLTPAPFTNPNQHIIVGNLNPTTPEESYELAINNVLSTDAPYLNAKENFYSYVRDRYGVKASSEMAELLKENISENPNAFFTELRGLAAGSGAFSQGNMEASRSVDPSTAKLFLKMISDPVFEESYLMMKNRELEQLSTFTDDYKFYRNKMPQYYQDVTTGWESIGDDIKNENIGFKKTYENLILKKQELDDHLEYIK